MTPAEFKAARQALRLTMRGLAEYLQVNARSIRRWERGVWPVPRAVVLAMEALARDPAPDLAPFRDRRRRTP